MNHHYVPECYLRQFLDSKEMLTVLNLKLFKERSKFIEQKKATAAVCYIPDMYDIPKTISPHSFFRDLSHYDPGHIEAKAFLDFENNFSKQYERLIGPEKILDKEFWTKGIISLKKRNPYYLEVQDFDLLRTEATKNLNKYLHTLTDDENAFKALDYVVSKIEKESDAKRKFNLTGLIHDSHGIDISSDAEKTIQSLKWDILLTDEKYPFTTTDNPGFAIASDGEFGSLKFLDDYREVSFYMPISPSHCLRIQSRPNKIYVGKIVREIKLSTYETFAINLGGIRFAKNLCISNTPSFFYKMKNEIASMFNFRNQLDALGFLSSWKRF